MDFLRKVGIRYRDDELDEKVRKRLITFLIRIHAIEAMWAWDPGANGGQGQDVLIIVRRRDDGQENKDVLSDGQ